MSNLFSPRALLVPSRTACFLVFLLQNRLSRYLPLPSIPQSGTAESWKSLELDVRSKTSFEIMVFRLAAKADCRILVGQQEGKEQTWSRTNVRSGGICKSWEARGCLGLNVLLSLSPSRVPSVPCGPAWKELSPGLGQIGRVHVKVGEQLRKSFIQQDVESPCTVRSGGEVGARGGRKSQSLLRDSWRGIAGSQLHSLALAG